MMPKATKKPAATISSARDLAARLDRSHTAVGRWLKDDRWTFARKAPWKASELPAMKKWAAETLEQQVDVTTDEALKGLSHERKAKLELVIERTAKVRLERELLAGRYLPREQVRADLVSRASEAKRMLQSVSGLAPRLVGRDEATIRQMLDDHLTIACNRIAGGEG